METAESVAMIADRVKHEIAKIRRQLEKLEDLILSLNDPELEANLRAISSEIRKSIALVSEELEPEESWLVG